MSVPRRALENLSGEIKEKSTGYASDEFPKKLGDVLAEMQAGNRRYFPYESWAMANHFDAGDGSMPFLRQCESAAEAFFLRPFTFRAGVTYRDESSSAGLPSTIVAVCGAVELALQVRCALSRIDVVLRAGRFRLAIEVDGLTYHGQSAEKIAADYIRERRIVCAGYTLIRFTAPEVFANADECWRQVDLVVESHTKSVAPVGHTRAENPRHSRSNSAAVPVDTQRPPVVP